MLLISHFRKLVEIEFKVIKGFVNYRVRKPFWLVFKLLTTINL